MAKSAHAPVGPPLGQDIPGFPIGGPKYPTQILMPVQLPAGARLGDVFQTDKAGPRFIVQKGQVDTFVEGSVVTEDDLAERRRQQAGLDAKAYKGRPDVERLVGLGFLVPVAEDTPADYERAELLP